MNDGDGDPGAAPFDLPRGVRQLGRSLATPAPGTLKSTQAAKAARDAEFQSGRELARSLLTACRAPTVEVPVAPDRSPVWPVGFVGSITHTTDWVGVAVARTADVAGLGIDAELIRDEHDVAHIESVCLTHGELG